MIQARLTTQAKLIQISRKLVCARRMGLHESASRCVLLLCMHGHSPPADKGWMRLGKWVEAGFEGFRPKYCLDNDQKEMVQEEKQQRVGDGPPALCCVRAQILFAELSPPVPGWSFRLVNDFLKQSF